MEDIANNPVAGKAATLSHLPLRPSLMDTMDLFAVPGYERVGGQSGSNRNLAGGPREKQLQILRLRLSDCLDCQGRVDGKAENDGAVFLFPTISTTAAD